MSKQPLELTLVRDAVRPAVTLGTLAVDGRHFCHTLEDKVRKPGEFVYGATAIPPGRYQVRITMSKRFGKLMPQLFDLPGRRTIFGEKHIDECGVRLHGGNTTADTLGCPLVGYKRGVDKVWQSASEDLTRQLLAAEDAGRDIFLTIL